MKTFIIVPTYNEVLNIERLINEIFDLKIFDLAILIIDDNSQDKTAQIVEKMQESYKQLFLIKRPAKLGLGSAYITGFKFALAKGADYIFEMDADFSHPPKYIPVIIQELLNNDLIIGSRYIAGGGVVNCSWWRKLLSRLANVYVQIILGLKIKDATAGFRGYRREIFEKINLNQIISDGYSFQVELVYLVKNAAFRIKEVPIIFPDRVHGSSKINRWEVFKAIATVLRLKIKNK